MGMLELLVEVLRLLKDMPLWMSAMVLTIVFIFAIGYLIGKVTGK